MEPQKTPNCQGNLEEKIAKLGVTILPDFRLLYKTTIIQIAWCSILSQLCLILCDPMDGRPPGSSVHRISQARIQCGLPFPPPGSLPNPKIKHRSPASPELASGFFTTALPRKYATGIKTDIQINEGHRAHAPMKDIEPTHLWSINLPQERQDCNGERQDFQQVLLGKLDSYM